MNSNNLILSKFNTIESDIFSKKISEHSIFEELDKLKFIEASSDLKKLIILNEIEKNSKISQKKLSEKARIVPAMINKYIQKFKNWKELKVSGTNHKNTEYFLTDKGKISLKENTLSFMQEILAFYKDIKNEIKQKLSSAAEFKNKKIIIYGANEFAEIICHFYKEFEFEIVAVVDSSSDKQKTYINSHKISDPDFLKNAVYDLVLITSLTGRNEIYDRIRYLEPEKKIYKFADLGLS